jgi:hypothetical protein
MRRLALTVLAVSLPLFADFFPPTVVTSIASVGENSISLNSPLPANGMSGIVIHTYGNDLEAITGRIVQNADGTVSLKKGEIIHHDKLPTIKTAVAPDDEVIGGYLYNNVLVLAPDEQTYARITSSHDKNWIHPDLFALFLSNEGDALPTKENLAKFANEYQVGLIYVVKNKKAVLLDPVSGQHVAEKAMQNLPANGKYPFYMRLDGIDTGWFGSTPKEGNYYKAVEAL